MNNQKNGLGKYFYKGGEWYEGEWKNDQKDGKGKFYCRDKSYYDGTFKEGEKHGIIYFYLRNTDTAENQPYYYQVYEMGQLLKQTQLCDDPKIRRKKKLNTCKHISRKLTKSKTRIKKSNSSNFSSYSTNKLTKSQPIKIKDPNAIYYSNCEQDNESSQLPKSILKNKKFEKFNSLTYDLHSDDHGHYKDILQEKISEEPDKDESSSLIPDKIEDKNSGDNGDFNNLLCTMVIEEDFNYESRVFEDNNDDNEDNTLEQSDTDKKNSLLQITEEQSSIDIKECKNIRKWTKREISNWLEEIELGKYKQMFEEQFITGRNIFTLTNDDLKSEFEMNLGERKNFFIGLERLKKVQKNYEFRLRPLMSQKINKLVQ